LRERPERRGYLLPAPQGLPHMSSLMSFPISLDNPSSPPPLRRQIKKFKKKESKEVKKKGGIFKMLNVSALPRKLQVAVGCLL
jgi:hypothetical protein